MISVACSNIGNEKVCKMKAIEITIGTKITMERDAGNCTMFSDYEDRPGKIIANVSRQGDEVVIVEWDDDFSIDAENVNDLYIVKKLNAYGIWNDSENCFVIDAHNEMLRFETRAQAVKQAKEWNDEDAEAWVSQTGRGCFAARKIPS